VELRPGIEDTLKAQRHHLITGRRGTGKSTLLHVVRRRLRQEGSPVAVIDMEKYKGRPFPGVLIEILIALLDEVKPRIRLQTFYSDHRLRTKFKKSRKELVKLLNDPQSVTRRLERAHKRARVYSGAAGVRGGVKSQAASLSTDLQMSAGANASEVATSSAEFVEMKIERLQQLASALSAELATLVKGSNGRKAIIFIDDFYYVQLKDQPDVLNYLQQVCKGTGIWLKVGGVGTRMRTFRDGDPPKGMQPYQDVDPLPIDVTLDDFATAQRFLERMLDGVLKPLGLTTNQLFTETARSRMVLACGGAVARDYVTLTAASLEAAVERLSKMTAPADDLLVKVQAEDVNLAARRRMNGKEEQELRLDAGSDAARLSDRWRDVCDFVREQGNTAFILVRQKDLDETEWGEEIRQIENLRLLHRIRDAVPNTPNWRGVKTVVFMVDLGQVANQRLRRGIPNFWESTGQFDRLRRAEWVYGPDWREKLIEKSTKRPTSSVRVKAHPSDEPDVPTLFDDPAEMDESSKLQTDGGPTARNPTSG
jgi:hypothetical protein